ncbi:MAG: hypothetical protein AAGB31_15555 [Bdellovibrio sp.]
MTFNHQVSCGDMHEQAMDSHVSCYIETGFCELDFSERSLVYWYLKGALFNAITWKEAQLVHRACWQKKNLTEATITN